VERWCIFSHTKAVDQRDVAEQGCDLPASCDNLGVLSARGPGSDVKLNPKS
jgi:hypothetical protein